MANVTNNEAKETFITKIINLFPDSYVGCFDKKYLFVENGVQIAVSMTCPKVPLGNVTTTPVAAPTPTPAATPITDDEKETLSKLMDMLGI